MPDRLTPETFTDKELKWSYWFVTHKLLIQKIIFIVLLVITTLLGLFFIYRVVDVYVLRGTYYRNGLSTLVSTTGAIGEMQLIGDRAIQDIQILDTQVLPSNGNHYDLFSQLGNANTQYVGYFEYRFNNGAEQTPWRKSFILPNQTRYVHELGVESDTSFSAATLEIQNFQWEKILEFDMLSAERLQMSINDVEYISSSVNEAGEESGNKVAFKVSNNASYSFRRVGFFVVLYLGQTVESVNYIRLDNVAANTSYLVDVPWYNSLGSVTRVEVIPEVNILDPGVYKKI